MIYVVQEDNLDAKPIYAGSSAHEAMLASSQHDSVRVYLFKNGKKYFVVKPTKG